MKFPFVVALLLVGTVLAACTTRNTSFSDPVPADVRAGWRLASVEVSVPDTLTVSEMNTYAPEADIVWHGDPIGQGTRQEQVAAILKDGITDAARRLSGGRAVVIRATLAQFHALSPIARQSVGGIHNVNFVLQVFDARTGEALTAAIRFEADEFALAGDAAKAAEARGETQKVRIRARIARVVETWLGVATPAETVVRGAVPTIGR